jgi:hypothetical membrane protein
MNRYDTLRIGALAWLLSFQYFIIQKVVASQWEFPFRPAHNTISDLGNTACGFYRGNLVCSPLYGLMNTSFLIQGFLMIVGAVCIARGLAARGLLRLGLLGILLAGVGSIIVGCFPENTVRDYHILGAGLTFILGNVGLILLGLRLPVARRVHWLIVASGIIALICLVLFVTHHSLGLGSGTIERLTDYPQIIWLIILGGYWLIKRPHLTP